MAEISVTPVRRPYSRIAVAAAALAVLLLLVEIFAGFGTRLGLWHFRTGFTLLRWAVYLGFGVIALAITAVIRTRPGSGRGGLPLAALALLVAVVVVAVPWSWRRSARGVPPIHDITTDTENPPQFIAVAPLRADAPNPIAYAGAEIADQQRVAYPDVRPLVLALPSDRAFQLALDAAHQMGWEIVDANPTTGRIEATDRTFWFGFKDDIVIRLTPSGSRTILDVRSLSRVGGSDAGTNAKRIRAYLAEVQR